MATKVIDVSVHQGTINWDLVKSQIDGAILRCGYGDNYTSQDDAQFARNLSECERLGIPRGVYLYSYATSDAHAQSELEHILRLIKGHTFQLPIYLDCEEAGTESYAARACNIICEGIKAAGYTPGVYSSTSWWNTYLTSVTKYRRWVAHWASACGYTGTYDIWQYGTSYINGINGPVDSNYCYIDFKDMIKSSGSTATSNTSTKTTGTTTKETSTSTLKIVQNYLVNNPCYQIGAKIAVQGLMLHSVGCAQPSGPTWCRIYATNANACVHAFIDANDGIVYQTLPWNHRGWHGGGSSNDTHIGVEMCESAYITYTTGASFTINDKTKAVADAKRAYNSAVELFASLCKQYNLNPLASGVIVSHSEGYRRGIASNHADPEHYWTQLGLSYTMDGFRKDVQSKLNGGSVSTPTTTTESTKTTTSAQNTSFPKTPFTVKVIISDLNMRKSASMSGAVMGQTGKGTFTITQVSGEWGKLKSNGYWIYLGSSEYCTIGKTVTTSTTKTTTTTTAKTKETTNKTTTSKTTSKPYKVKVTADVLNIRNGAGTNYAIVGTIQDQGIYTIVETKGTWGKLKSGAGWISLNYTKKV